jgi:hypothetical protein
MLSSWTPFAELARQASSYRKHLEETPEALRANPSRGHVDIARWVYVAETDAKAKRESEAGLMRNLAHFSSGHTSGYLGTVSQDVGASPRDYDALTRDIILHDRRASGDGRQCVDHAALPAMVRRGQGTRLARAFCRRGDSKIQRPSARAKNSLEHDPEKWVPVSGKDHAQT